MNLKLPVFDWDNEVFVVKQSASALVGGVVPFLVMLILTRSSLDYRLNAALER